MKKKNKNIKVKKPKNVLARTTFWMVVLLLATTLFTVYQLKVQEEGILDVCATQQDAYVQLVLDQINLKENRDDEEIITDILSTLDSSTNKYWTFSKDKDMLFVKDVIETNRYKGLTAISYYDSESAKAFMQSLKLNKVIHRSITVGEKEYVASGVAFEYGGDNYRLCLLTNKDVILNNNKFMEARIEMMILVGYVLVIVIVTSMMFARRQLKIDRDIFDRELEIKELQKTISQMNNLYGQKEHYDTRYQLWSRELIGEFVKKLKAKNVHSAIAVKLHCMNENDKKEFFDKASVILDKRVLRFTLNDKDILLLFMKNSKYIVNENLKRVINAGVMLDRIEEVFLDEFNAEEYIKGLDKEVY